jgi:hypothetical protein
MTVAGMAPALLTPTHLGGLRVQKVSEMAPRVNMLIYGDPGVGKTLLCASSDAVPEMRRVLLIDVDGGALTARETFPNVDVLQVTTWGQLQLVYDDLFASSTHGYQTVILDTATEAQKLSMVEVMKKAVKRAEEDGKDRDEEVPSVREWGISSEQVRRIVRNFRNLPVNFLMTAHVAEDKDERTGLVKKAPDLPGKLKRQIAGFFDVVMYMYIREVKEEGTDEAKELRLLMSAATSKITAKDRTQKLARIEQVPTMKSLYAKMTQIKETASV